MEGKSFAVRKYQGARSMGETHGLGRRMFQRVIVSTENGIPLLRFVVNYRGQTVLAEF